MLLSIVGFLLCCYLGFYLASKVKNEKNILNGLIRFNKSMIINLEYEKSNITDFIKKYKDDSLSPLTEQYVKQLKKGKPFDIDIKNNALKKEIENYFSHLGKSDAKSQVEFAKSYEKVFQMHYEEFCLTGNKKISLYPKLGIMFGGILFIILL